MSGLSRRACGGHLWTLNAFVRSDLEWLLLVTTPRSLNGYQPTPTIKTPGNQLSLICEANTFPPSKGDTGLKAKPTYRAINLEGLMGR